METPQIRIITEEFRAIGKAEIAIDGITVVAGENGCGKSTISKLLYHLYKTASSFELLVFNEVKYKLRNVERFLEIALFELFTGVQDRKAREDFRKELFALSKFSDTPLEVQAKSWLSMIEKVAELNTDENQNKKRINTRSNRFKFILKDILRGGNIDEKSTGLPFDKIRDFVEIVFLEASERIQTRPSSLFKEALKSVFSDDKLPGVFDVLEFEEQIISLNNDYISIPYLVQNVVYIDTPMMIGIEQSDNIHWDDLNKLLSRKGNSKTPEISDSIRTQIIQGEVAFNDDNSEFSDDFVYKREDGKVFNLLDCATGVKSFAILQLLIKNGSLNDKTLLIIDEPESNLHPQWIVEYARLIVMLNKKIGLKIFVATHNPDMVSAIKYISLKEEVASRLNFYLAEKANSSFTYNYRSLGNEIDPIFESFNIAIDRIHQYGN
jgi:predicted ATP-dependent endonuclease of OLD family